MLLFLFAASSLIVVRDSHDHVLWHLLQPFTPAPRLSSLSLTSFGFFIVCLPPRSCVSCTFFCLPLFSFLICPRLLSLGYCRFEVLFDRFNNFQGMRTSWLLLLTRLRTSPILLFLLRSRIVYDDRTSASSLVTKHASSPTTTPTSAARSIGSRRGVSEGAGRWTRQTA